MQYIEATVDSRIHPFSFQWYI